MVTVLPVVWDGLVAFELPLLGYLVLTYCCSYRSFSFGPSCGLVVYRYRFGCCVPVSVCRLLCSIVVRFGTVPRRVYVLYIVFALLRCV